MGHINKAVCYPKLLAAGGKKKDIDFLSARLASFGFFTINAFAIKSFCSPKVRGNIFVSQFQICQATPGCCVAPAGEVEKTPEPARLRE